MTTNCLRKKDDKKKKDVPKVILSPRRTLDIKLPRKDFRHPKTKKYFSLNSAVRTLCMFYQSSKE